MPLLLVQAFVNTRDLEDGSDRLGDADAMRAWFLATGLLASHSTMTPDDVELARTTRESIRSMLEPGDDHARGGAELGPLRELAATHQPRLTVRAGGVLALENPRHDDLGDGLFELLLIIRRAQEDGSWSRLKVCASPGCRWAFYDRSRNQQGNWCDMAVCGNRFKNRELRARRR
jgi:predicted RNA-binding Zn ribbon-like protein